MPTDAETLKWVSVADFSPGIYAPRGVVLNATGPSQTTFQQSGAPLGSAQLDHAIVDIVHAQHINQILDLADYSGNGYGLTDVGPSDLAVAGLVSGNGAIRASASSSAVGAIISAFTDPTLVAGSWWICGWVNDLTDFGTLLQVDESGGHSPCLALFFQPDTPGVTTFVRLTRIWSSGANETKTIGAIPVTPGPNFLFGSYNAGTDTYKMYVDGVLVSTQTGGGHAPFASVLPTSFFVGGSPLAGTKIYDECAIGKGVIVDATVTALYAAASTSYSAYRAAQLAMTPLAYYPLDSTPAFDIPYSRVTSPGTFRCVSAPGKGLIGAPRRVPTAQVRQSYPIVAGTSNDDIIHMNTMVDSSGNAHHGEYDLTQLTRAPGAFGDDGAIQQVSTTSPILPSVTPVAVLQFNSDWTVNVWAKIADTGASVGHTLLDVISPSTGSRIKLTYFNKLGANQFFMSLARTPNGAATVTYVPPATTYLTAGYHMLTFKFNLAGCFATLYVDGVLIGSSAVVAAPAPAIFGTDAVITTAFEGLTGDTWDEFSLHAALLTNANVTAIFAANTDHPTYKTEILTFTPTSYYAFSEDGTHATGEARALITASHLISPVVDGSSSLQQTIPVAPAYQDGLFISYSQFVDQTSSSTTLMNNRVDCRFYKLWRDPIEYFSLTEAFPNGEESFIVLKRIDNTNWSAPFWHGVADFAEIVNSVSNNGVTPFTRQVAWLFNMVQSRISTNPYAFLIVGYPRASAHTTDSIEALASKALGAAFFTPELVFSHEGRLCAIDGYDGDGFGSGASGRGMNDIVYYTIRGADYAGPQVFSLQRPIEENQSGIRVAQSVNANELFLVKSIGGGAVISGDMDFPTIRRLPGLHSPGDIYAKPINTPLGIVYAGYGGVFLWSGAESSQLISEQFDGPFWNPHLGAFARYTPAANRFGFQGGFGWLYPWLLSPSFFMWDSRFQSWWVLDDPSDLYPSLFMHGTGQGHILAVYPEINDNSDVIADRYDSELQATNYAWTSQPITPEMFRVATVREINIQATVDAPNEDATILITVAALDGTYEQNTITLNGDARPHTYRATFAVDTETFIVSFNATGGTGGNLAAPIIHSFRVGYELTAQHPEMSV